MKLNQIIAAETDRTEIHFLRQVVSSTASFALEFAAMVFLTEIPGLHYLISAVLGFLLGNLLLYLLSIRWIYNERRFENSRVELSIFLTLAGLSLLVNTGLLAFLVEVLKIHYILAKPAGACTIFFLNFIIKELWLFNAGSCEEKGSL